MCSACVCMCVRVCVCVCVASSSVFQKGSCTPANPILCLLWNSTLKTAHNPETTKASFTHTLTITHADTHALTGREEEIHADSEWGREEEKHVPISYGAVDVAGWLKNEHTLGQWFNNKHILIREHEDCASMCVCSDLDRALFDLVAARGVETRGLLEEELSGCLECLRKEEIRMIRLWLHTSSHFVKLIIFGS